MKFLVFLLYTTRRVDCRRSGVVTVEEVPWGDGKRTLTKAYMLFLARWARRLSWKETAEAFRTSWDKVFEAVEHVVTWGLEHRTLGQIDAIGVDEIQYSKRQYLTLVYQIDLGVTRLLWIGKERTIESFQGFFTTMGEEITSKIVFICSDMWEPYLKVIREKCSEALHILDRFHIVAKMNKALDESPRRRIAPHGERRPDTAPEKVALAPAQAGRESEGRAALPTARSPPLQLEDRPGLPSQGSVPATLGLQLALLGREVSRRVVPSNHAFPHRAHEEDRSISSPAPGTDPQLLPGAKNDFQRVVEGLNNKASHPEKILWLSYLPGARTLPISLAWQAA